MDLGFLLFALSAIVNIAAVSTCYLTTSYASTSRSSRSIDAAAYECRIIKIIPYPYYSSDWYYLELSWSSSHFDVKGNMPLCTEDNLEVFLTRNSHSIGKFCSHNAGKPFTMYSRDGYASMRYSSNGYASNSGFTFYYQLRAKISHYLGYLSSSACDNSNNNGSSGVIYSTGWPLYSKEPYTSCSHKIFKSDDYQGIFVVFMDINIPCFFKDYVQLHGSNTSSNYTSKAISTKLCSTQRVKAYNTYSSYLKIERHLGNMQSFRGFVAGYIMFSTPTPLLRPSALLPTRPLTRSYTIPESIGKPADEHYSDNSSTAGILLGVLIPILIIIIIVVAVFIYNKNRERPDSGTVDQTHPLTSMPESSSHKITSQQALQAAAPPTYTTIEFSQPRHVNPTAPMLTAINPTGSNNYDYPTTQHYSGGQCTFAGDAPLQYPIMPTPTHSSTPAGTIQQSQLSVGNRQEPDGALNRDPSVVTDIGGSAPISMSFVDAPPSTPPPSYQDAINS